MLQRGNRQGKDDVFILRDLFGENTVEFGVFCLEWFFFPLLTDQCKVLLAQKGDRQQNAWGVVKLGCFEQGFLWSFPHFCL